MSPKGGNHHKGAAIAGRCQVATRNPERCPELCDAGLTGRHCIIS